MTEVDERERIRQRKLQELKQSLESPTHDDGAASDSTPTQPIHVTDQAHFKELVAEYAVVVVDFYADWCGPCQMIAPIMQELAVESPAVIAKVDIDTNQALAANHDVRGVPTVFVFADGAPVERIVGVRGKQDYQQLIDRYSS